MIANQHYIGKLTLDCQCWNDQLGQSMQQVLGRLCREKFLPLLEERFSQIVKPEVLIRLDQIELDLGAISGGIDEALILSRLEEALAKELREIATNALYPKETQSLHQDTFSAWLQYLEKGTLPWYKDRMDAQELQQHILQELSERPLAQVQLKGFVHKKPHGLLRLVLQSPEHFLAMVFKKLHPGQWPELTEVRQVMEQLFKKLPQKNIHSSMWHLWGGSDRQFYRFFWMSLFRWSEQKGNQSFWHFVQAIVSAWLAPKLADTSLEVLQKELEHISVKNANLKKNFQACLSKIRVALVQKRASQQGQKADIDSQSPSSSKAAKFTENNRELSDQREENEEQLGPSRTSESNLTDTDQSISFLPENQLQKESNRADEVFETWMTNGIIPVPQHPFIDPSAKAAIEGWYVQMAGLVLLHPFLPTFFEASGWLKDKAFVDDDSRALAVLSLQYLVVGSQNSPEYDLTFAKFLCDFSLEAPLDIGIDLADSVKMEADKLLQVVINYWPSIGNISPDGLREGFLQRDGKLKLTESGWLLQVETKAIDILIDRLSWGIGVIKLPWMNNMLRVEWVG